MTRWRVPSVGAVPRKVKPPVPPGATLTTRLAVPETVSRSVGDVPVFVKVPSRVTGTVM